MYAEPLRGNSILKINRSPGVPGIQFIALGRMKD